MKQLEQIVRKDLAASLISYSDKSKGADHKVYILNTAKGKFVLREPKESVKRRLMTQWYAMNAWRKIRIPVPAQIKKTTAYIIEEYIEGQDMSDARLTFAQKKRIMFDLGKILRRMHTIRTKRYGYLAKPAQGEHKHWEGYCNKKFYQLIDDLNGLYPQSKLRMFRTAYKKYPEHVQDVAPTLLHMDLGVDNIMVKNGRINAIIDAGDVISGDPMYEVAIVHACYRTKRLSNAILEGYGPVDMDKVHYYALFQSLWWVLYFSKIKKGQHPERVKRERSNVAYYLKRVLTSE